MNTQDMTLKQQVHKKILYDIVQGEYTLESVIHEKKLMEKYGVSRAPIREALIQLCSENVLTNLPKKGYTINALSEKDLSDMIHFRISLECGFLRQFGEKIEAGVIALLEEHNEEHHKYKTVGLSALEHWDKNMKFHLLLFKSYANPYAYHKLEECLTTQTRYYVQKRLSHWQSPSFYDAYGLHCAIVDYLKISNFNMAATLLKADIEDTSWC